LGVNSAFRQCRPWEFSPLDRPGLPSIICAS